MTFPRGAYKNITDNNTEVILTSCWEVNYWRTIGKCLTLFVITFSRMIRIYITTDDKFASSFTKIDCLLNDLGK